MFKTALAAAVVALSASVPAIAQDSTLGKSLDNLLDYARQRSPELRMQQQEAQAAAERILPAGALPDPRFRTELRDVTKLGEQFPTLFPAQAATTRYQLTQDLPWLGKRDLRREAAEFQAEAAQGRVAGSWSELAGRIKSTYARLYYLEQNERLSREIVDLMARLEQVAQARYAAGLAAQQDVIRAQLEQTALRNELIGLDAERAQLKARMNALIGRISSAPLAAPESIRMLPSPDMVNIATVEQRARDNSPVLKAEASQIRAAEKNRELAYKNRYPDFTVGLAPIQYQSSIREWELMIEVNIPLQQGSRRAQEREAEAMLEVARSRREAASNQVLAELHENVAAFTAARRALALTSESLLPQSELTFRSALAGYEAGKIDFATLLDAQKQIRQARLSQVRAGTEAHTRLAEIERIIGEGL